MSTNTAFMWLWVVCSALYGAVVTYQVYRRRGRSHWAGFRVGGILGALGSLVLIVLLTQGNPEAAAPSLVGLGGLGGGLLFLLPVWWLVPRHGQQCAYCCQVVDAHALVCPHCRHSFPGAPAAWDASQPILSVRDLMIEYQTRYGRARAVDGVDLDLRNGELLALVGESGCGKSTLAYGLIRHVTFPGEITGGRILFQNRNVLDLTDEQLRRFRWSSVAVIFQAAQNALNPVMRVADQFIDTVQAHEEDQSREQILRKAAELLDMVRLDPGRVLHAYPFELSGGMRQRVVIALSLLLDPKLLILDEPTTALDVVTQVHVLDILKDIRDKLGVTMLMSTHDMSIVARVADRVAVMYAGKIVEVAPVRDIFYHPYHPYTAGLIRAAPSLVGQLADKQPIPGLPPDLMHMPAGCRFHPRCLFAIDRCRERIPAIEPAGDSRSVACHRWREIAEEVRQ